MLCTVLHCTVMNCCRVLWCRCAVSNVPYCSALYCSALYCTVLYSDVLCCTVLYCSALPCGRCSLTRYKLLGRPTTEDECAGLLTAALSRGSTPSSLTATWIAAYLSRCAPCSSVGPGPTGGTGTPESGNPQVHHSLSKKCSAGCTQRLWKKRMVEVQGVRSVRGLLRGSVSCACSLCSAQAQGGLPAPRPGGAEADRGGARAGAERGGDREDGLPAPRDGGGAAPAPPHHAAALRPRDLQVSRGGRALQTVQGDSWTCWQVHSIRPGLEGEVLHSDAHRKALPPRQRSAGHAADNGRASFVKPMYWTVS